MATARLTIVDDRQEAEPHLSATVRQALVARRQDLSRALAALALDPEPIAEAAAAMSRCLLGGGKVLAAGNGGSAAEAQHFVAELVGRFRRERAPLPALALTADSATLTALGNDYGFEQVYARQVVAWARPGDVLVLFSTSGESPNVLAAAMAARSCRATTVAVCGQGASSLAASCDIAIAVPSRDTPVVQELHAVTVHLICDLVETACMGKERRS